MKTQVKSKRRGPAKERKLKAAPKLKTAPKQGRASTPKRAQAPAQKRARAAAPERARRSAKGARPSPAATRASQASPPAPLCAEGGCSTPATTRGFCRLHYIKNWKAIKARERKAARRRSYDEDLLHKVPVDYEDRGDRMRPPVQRSLDVELARAREDVEEMFREMGFEEDL
jgi:hypothetical protein